MIIKTTFTLLPFSSPIPYFPAKIEVDYIILYSILLYFLLNTYITRYKIFGFVCLKWSTVFIVEDCMIIPNDPLCFLSENYASTSLSM